MKTYKHLSSKSILCILFLFLLIPVLIAAETARIDSLLLELKGSRNEDKYEILHDLGWAYRDISTDKALFYETQAIDLARDWGDSIRVARSLYNLSRIKLNYDFESSISHSKRSIKLIIETSEINEIAPETSDDTAETDSAQSG